MVDSVLARPNTLNAQGIYVHPTSKDCQKPMPKSSLPKLHLQKKKKKENLQSIHLASRATKIDQARYPEEALWPDIIPLSVTMRSVARTLCPVRKKRMYTVDQIFDTGEVVARS